jgi:hypothetical protein
MYVIIDRPLSALLLQLIERRRMQFIFEEFSKKPNKVEMDQQSDKDSKSGTTISSASSKKGKGKAAQDKGKAKGKATKGASSKKGEPIKGRMIVII